MAGVTLRNVCKTYDKDVVAVNNFNLEIEDKEFVVFVGPSGCGKTTTLRMVAGLEQITSGEISIGERVINSVAPKDRDIAMVFQNYALYPHMTVFENMAFSLKLRKVPKKEIETRVIQAAKVLNIENLLKRQPKQLSGGQKQRVAIGRAIVRSPQVFLMDEPLSNLDAKLRNQMRAELITLHKRIDTTIIYVTHDQVEAMTLGDRIVVMKDGVIQQAGSPQEVFNRPANMFVAGFIGTPQMNFIEDARLTIEGGKYVVKLLGTSYTLPPEKQDILKQKNITPCEVTAGVRPEDVEPCSEGGIRAFVELSELMGSEKYLHVNVNAQTLVLRVKAGVDVQSGNALFFKLLDDKIHLFDKTTDINLLA